MKILEKCSWVRGAALAVMSPSLASACYAGMPYEDGDDIAFKKKQALADIVLERAQAHGVTPLPAAPSVRPALFELGRALAFDKILSGNKDISCMTCHHPTLGSGDARSLSIGVGGTGLGTKRAHPAQSFIPRSAPPLFNLHAMETMFWDGRVNERYGNVTTPAGDHVTPAMRATFEFGAVSAQAMFPVTSDAEMRGLPGQNELADIPATNFTAIWNGLMARLGAIPKYVEMFEAAYPGTKFEDMTFAHAANALAGFEIAAFESRGSTWDEFLGGKKNALNSINGALEGAAIFFERGCADCHSGPSFSDFEFHNTCLPQVGPGKGDGNIGRDDFGRFRETGSARDRYAFRTAPLRNVEFTAPYGHAGQFPTLAAFVEHYVDPEVALYEYDADANLEPLLRHLVLDNADDMVETAEFPLTSISSTHVPSLVAFLRTLSDKDARENKLKQMIPNSVPSGLPVAD